MKITGIHVDGFGVWHDRHWTDLSPGLHVFLGPNETGKTTLMSFVRSILFGFERRDNPRHYEPLSGGNHGGVLDVVHRGRALRIARKPGRYARGAVTISGDGIDDGDEAMLESILEGTTRTLYHNVFAFGLEELEQFGSLQESEVASHISGAGMGIGAARWTTAWKDLEDRRSRLFKPRGQNQEINQALEELRQVEEELDRTEAEPEEYARAHDEQRRIAAEIPELERRVLRLSERVRRYERLREAEPHRKRREALTAELSALECVERFPEGGVVRLNVLFDQQRALDADLERLKDQSRRLRAERATLAADYTPQDLVRRERTLDSLRGHMPRLEAARIAFDEAREAHDAIESERVAIASRRETVRPPSPVATLAFAGVVGVVVAVLALSGNGTAAGGLGFAMALMGGWYYQRLRRVRAIDRALAEVEARLQTRWTRANRREIEVERLRSLLEEWTGKREISNADLEREAAEVRRLARMADRIRSIDQGLSEGDAGQNSLEARIDESHKSIAALLEEAGADSEAVFFRRADAFRERQRIQLELDRLPPEPADVTLDVDDPAPSGPGRDLSDVRPDDDAGFEAARAAHDASVEQLNAMRGELGALGERIAALAQSERRSRARVRHATVSARLDEASGEWAVLTLCRKLLEETRKVYESDRQPEVLTHASGFLARMSGGRWRRVVTPLGSEELFIESGAGDRVTPDRLSRGTAEQLYLSMRLALVREYSNHVDPLPVVFDDIFVNFDPDRTGRALDAVRDLTATHQVLMFTCHPHMVDIVRDCVPDARISSLEGR